MNLLPDAMFPDRVDVYPSVATTARDPSGGRSADESPALRDVPCTCQPANESEILAAKSLGYDLQTKVLMKLDTSDLRTGSRLRVLARNGVPVQRETWLTVKATKSEGLGPLTVYTLDCQGRA